MINLINNLIFFIIGIIIALWLNIFALKSNIEPLEIVEKIPHVDLGEHVITYYCNPAGNRTASGTKTTENRTIAVDINGVLKFGDIVYIEGFKKPFIAEDTGALIKNKRIDIYIDDCDKALKNGVDKLKVYKIGE